MDILFRELRECLIYFRKIFFNRFLGFPGGSDGEESPCNAGDPGSIPGLGGSLPGSGTSPGEGMVIHSNILA